MDYIISCHGITYGDIYPLLGVAFHLKQNGANVVFITNNYYKNLVESVGLKFLSSGSADLHSSVLQKSGFGISQVGNKLLFKQLILPSVKTQYQLLKHQVIPTMADPVIITRGHPNGALILAEELNLPSIKLNLSPPTQKIISRWRGFFSLNQELASYTKVCKALSPLAKFQSFMIDSLTNRFSLGLYPSWYLDQSNSSNSSNSIPVGFPQLNLADKLAPEVDEFILKYGKPFIFMPGTMINSPSNFFEESFDLCKLLGVPGVFIAKDSMLAVDSTNKVLYTPYLNIFELMKRSRLIVHAGGVGVTSQAMMTGLPQLIVPRVNDQFYNSRRAMALGSASVLSAKSYSATLAVIAVRNIRDNEKTKTMRQELQKKLLGHDGSYTAAQIILKYFQP